MNYKGYLLRVDGVPVNSAFFRDYKSIPNTQTDLDPWTDNAGLTHRNVLPHKRSTITFTTPPLYLEDKIKLQALFPNRTKVALEYWNDETNDYTTGDFYVPDVTYEVMMLFSETIQYRPITYELIEY